MKLIPLSRGLFAVVDDEDYEKVAQFKWCAISSGHTFYAQRSFYHRVDGILKTTSTTMHRFILGVEPGVQVDHIDHDGLNNTRDNLRVCTNAQNQHNQAKYRGTSKYKGVSLYRRNGLWRAKISVSKHHYALGYFSDEESAARAYDVAALKYFGEFAWLNFPQEATGGAA